jgi:Family of unknown function (DUF6318)
MALVDAVARRTAVRPPSSGTHAASGQRCGGPPVPVARQSGWQGVGYVPAVRTWTRTLLASVLVTLAVAGCSDKSKTTKPELSHSPSPSASAAPKPPAAASAHTRDGAIAFARYWWGPVADYAYNNLDSTQLRATSSADCAVCQAYIRSVDDAKQRGDKFDGGQATLLDVEAPPVGSDQPQPVDVLYNRTAQQHLDKAGKLLNTDAAVSQSSVELTLSWTGGHWVVTKVQRVGS